MKYSLLVPCYNAEAYIDSFLENISKLNKAFDEMLFYDDASTDDTFTVLTAKGCNVIKGSVNKGPGYARNILAEKATGEWLHFHDIDDGLHPDYLIKTSAIAQKNDVDVILCNVDWYDAQTRSVFLEWHYADSELQQDPVAYTISHPIGGINGLYRKKKFMDTGGFNTNLKIWEDADLHVRLAGNKAQFFIIEEVLSYAIRYPVSASSDQVAGWLTRTRLLHDYYKTFQTENIKKTIGQQCQIAASSLILVKQFKEARKALQISELCKVKVPLSNAKVWKLFKLIIPASIRIELRIIQLKTAFGK